MKRFKKEERRVKPTSYPFWGYLQNHNTNKQSLPHATMHVGRLLIIHVLFFRKIASNPKLR